MLKFMVVLINLLISLINLLTLQTMDLVKAEYEGQAITYWFCQIAVIVIVVVIFLHLIFMIGRKRWWAIYAWISDAPRVIKNFWKCRSRKEKIRVVMITCSFAIFISMAYFIHWTYYCVQVVDCFGIPVAGDTLTWDERQGRASYWCIKDYPLQHRMTLSYVEAYHQLDVMSKYSTLYERNFFQPAARIEIEYQKDKEFYKNYQEDFYSSASQINYRIPLKVSYYNSSNKLVLELNRDSYNNMEIVTYISEDKPQLLNTTLLRIPDGQVGENGILGQKIETVYNPSGLPELRRFYSDSYNLYGVNGEHYSYNKTRQISSLCYLDAMGEPVCNKLGVMMVEFEYQDDTNLRSIRYYGDQKGSERVEGFHGVFCEILEYDEGGKNISSRRQKDRSENWCFDANGVYQYCYQYENGALVREEFLAVDNAPIQNMRFDSRWVQFRTENQGKQLYVELEPVIAMSGTQEETAPNTFQTLKSSEKVVFSDNEFSNTSLNNFSYNQETTANVLKNKYTITEATDSEPVSSRRHSCILYTLKNSVVTEISYWDSKGHSVSGEQGCAAIQFEYERSQVVRESYWSSKGEPCILSGGYTAVKYVYSSDRDQNLVEIIYLDAKGQPVVNLDVGYAIVSYERSGARQELVQISYYDKERNLIPLPDKGYAKVEQRYDINGFLIQETFYDANEAIACRTDYGVAKIRYEYAPDGNLIRKSYWDQEDNAVSRRDTGYAVVNQTFIHGQLVEKRFEAYRNRIYYPVPDRETGATIITYCYKDGQKVKEEYLDKNRDPILSVDRGCASLIFEYECGRLRKRLAFGTKGELILQKNTGYSILEVKYDQFEREKEVCYLDTNNMPICRSDTGYAKVAYEYDSFGRMRSIKYYDTVENLVLHKEKGYAGVEYEYPDGNTQVWCYIGLDGNTFHRRSGYGIAKVTIISDSTGKIQRENYQDINGQPTVRMEHGYSGLSYDYDENGLKTQDSLFDIAGNLTLSLDGGYARKTYEYDNAGRIIRTRYYGENKEPVINTKYHCAGFEYEYDERGLESVIRYLGLDGNPAIRLDYGVSEVRHTFDSTGNLTRGEYYIGDKLATRKEWGYAVYEDTYENGLWVEARYYDTEGKLVPLLNRGYAITRQDYDDYGRIIRRHYYDVEDNPVINSYYGCAGFEYAYNEQGFESMICYLDTDGKPMIRQDLGYAKIKKEYDAIGNVITEYYLDENGELTDSNSKGFAICQNTYDERGKRTKSEYFDKDGNPTTWKNQGHSITKWEYDSFGQLIAIYYCDANENLIVNQKEGCAGFRYDYDEIWGNWTDTRYVSPENENQVMVKESSGYAHVSYKRDTVGRVTETYYFLTEDESIPVLVNGYNGIRKKYQNHNLVQIEYIGPDATLMRCSDEGYSVAKYTYNAYGQKTSIFYYDIDGESLIFNRNYGCAGIIYVYDIYGNQTDVCYLSATMDIML